jgi:hypothetical protein
MNCPKKTLKGEFLKSQVGLSSRVHSDQMVLDLVKGGQRRSKLSNSRGPSGSVHSDQMVLLVLARQEDGPGDMWPKKLKGELGNNSKNPRDLVVRDDATIKYKLLGFTVYF